MNVKVARTVGSIAMTFLAAGCGGGGGGSAPAAPPPTYTVGGTVSGLSGTGLVLQNNGVDLPVAASGAFTFPAPLNSGATYSITVKTQPLTPSQTCLMGNAGGSITGANVTGVTVTCTTNSYAVGGTVSGLVGGGLVLRNNNGNNLSVTADGAFSFTGTVLSGSSYSVSVLEQPTLPVQRCTVSNASGSIVAAAVNSVAINCVRVVTRFAYATNFDDGTVSMYTANTDSGQLRHNGYVLAGAAGTSVNPHSVAVDPANRFAFVSNFGSDSLTAYKIETSGRLTAVNDGVTGVDPRGVVVEASGRFAYVANSGANTVSAFQVDANSGALSALAGSPFTAGTNPFAVVADGTGRFLYVANFGGSISVFRIEANGILTSVDADAVTAGVQSSIAAGLGAHALTLTRTGRFAFTANFNGNNVSAYQVDGTTGALTVVPGSPFAAGAAPRGVTVDPTGRFAYVANHLSDTISVFAIDAGSGALNLLQTAPAPPSPGGVTLDANSTVLWTASLQGDLIASYEVDDTLGTLTRLRDVVGRKQNLELAIATGATVVSYRPNVALVSDNFSNTLASYQINAATGALSTVGSVAAGGGNTLSITADPAGRFAYVVNTTSDQAAVFSINATGVLASAGAPTTTGTFPGAMTLDPSGRFAYVTTYVSNTVQGYAINATTGLLTSTGTPQFGGQFMLGVRVDPRGRFAYVLATDSQLLIPYSINPQTGALTLIVGNSAATGNKPRGLAIDPTGRFIYVANDTSNNVNAYAINPNLGTPTSIGPAVAAGTGVSYVEVDPAGRFVYAVNVSDNTVSTYSIHSATGALTEVLPRVATGTLPTAIHIEASGRYAYVTNRNSGAISAYERNVSTGVLTRIDANPGAAGQQDFPGVGNAITSTATIE